MKLIDYKEYIKMNIRKSSYKACIYRLCGNFFYMIGWDESGRDSEGRDIAVIALWNFKKLI